jgi:hypothetical protein
VEVANAGDEGADLEEAPDTQAPGHPGTSFVLRVHDDAALKKAIELLRAISGAPAKAA